MDKEKLKEALIKKGYKVSFFTTAEEAAEYLDGQIDGVTVGFGDSMTMVDMGLRERLKKHNPVVWDPQEKMSDELYEKLSKEEPSAPWYEETKEPKFYETARRVLTTEVYLTSLNALSETGEIINIDGTGNRVAGSLFGHRKVYFVASTVKVEPTLEKAVWRARNIAAPKNAMRLHKKTPCAVKGDRCYDCNSPDRICNGLMIHLHKMSNVEMEIVLFDEALGY